MRQQLFDSGKKTLLRGSVGILPETILEDAHALFCILVRFDHFIYLFVYF